MRQGHRGRSKTGHVHYYQRTRPMKNGKPVASPADGTIHLISLATTGHQWKRKMPEIPDYIVKVMSGGPWYQKFDIDGNRLVFHTYDTDGNVLDELSIEK